MFKVFMKFTVILFCLLGGVYTYALFQLKDFSSFDKKSIDGNYAQLPDGKVYYKWFGQNNDEITILIHDHIF